MHYTETSPPVVYKDLVIVGNGVGDRLVYKNDPPGDVRAFDARTGKRVWSFHTIPQAGEFGNDTWGNDSWKFTGHTNVWAPMSLDERRGLLYLPVSTPSNDFYGGNRPGNNLVRRDAGMSRRQYRREKMALSDRPSRLVGLRSRVAADPGDDQRRWKEDRRGRAAHQARIRVRLRPRHRQTGVAD